MENSLILDALSKVLDTPIAFHRIYAEYFNDVATALYVQQMLYWSDKGKRKDGFVFKTKAELEYETTLSSKVQDRCRKLLESQGLLETKLIKAHGVPTLHYKMDKTAFFSKILEYAQREYPRVMPVGYNPLTENTTENTNNNYIVPSNDGNSVKSKNKQVKRFVKPNPHELRAYADSIGFLDLDPNEFLDFYESKDWYIGKSKMKDWQASVRTWFRSWKKRNPDYIPPNDVKEDEVQDLFGDMQ